MGIFFSILSPALYGINNYIDKFFLEKYDIKPIVFTIYSAIFGLIAGLIVLLFTGFYPTDPWSLFVLLSSGFLTNMFLLPYFKALSTDETSRVVPLFQFTPIFVLVLSYLFLGEVLQKNQYIGSIIIIAGSFLISLEKFDRSILKIRPAFWYMMLSSFLFGVSIVLYKLGVENIPFWNTLPYEGLGMAIGGTIVFLCNKHIFIKQTLAFPKKVYMIMGVNETIYILGRYTTYFALSLISASIVNVLGGFQPLFVLIYGIVLALWFPKLIKEVISKEVLAQKIIAIALIFIGVFFIFS